SIILKTENDLPPLPNNLILFQNYPNPFNSSTKVRYILPVSSRVSLKIYDLIGQEVRDIFEVYQNAGEYEFTLDFKNLTSGVYLYVLKTDYQSIAKKLILLK
ncbi:MAG: T9SS type A sorting domain-containing protein, partial [Ignavibacteria bacterium]